MLQMFGDFQLDMLHNCYLSMNFLYPKISFHKIEQQKKHYIYGTYLFTKFGALIRVCL